VQTLKQAIAGPAGQDRPGKLNPHSFTPRQALLVVAHLAGDIHQPLHVGAAMSARTASFVVPTTSTADVDELSTSSIARGGNNLQLDDEKLSAQQRAT
jgi:hypothetical protein